MELKGNEALNMFADDDVEQVDVTTALSVRDIYPLFLLQDYLDKLLAEAPSSDMTPTTPTSPAIPTVLPTNVQTDRGLPGTPTPNTPRDGRSDKTLDEVLRVCDSLFGNMLGAALSLLDNSEHIITKIATAQGSTSPPSVAATAPRRSFFLVKGSRQWTNFNSSMAMEDGSASPMANMSASSTMHSPQHEQVGPYYLCIVPQPTDVHRNCYYCSCRSFLEKSKANDHRIPALPRICKHLLALLILPSIEDAKYQTITTSTDEEFANLIMERTFR